MRAARRSRPDSTCRSFRRLTTASSCHARWVIPSMRPPRAREATMTAASMKGRRSFRVPLRKRVGRVSMSVHLYRSALSTAPYIPQISLKGTGLSCLCLLSWRPGFYLTPST